MYKKGTQVRRLKQLSSIKDTNGGFMKSELNAEQYLKKFYQQKLLMSNALFIAH